MQLPEEYIFVAVRLTFKEVIGISWKVKRNGPKILTRREYMTGFPGESLKKIFFIKSDL